MLKQGDIAPDFELKDQNGINRKFSDYRGKKIVLYFYPKDMTSGCTKEACGFRDDSDKFTKKGVEVIGVSTDTIESHKKFAEKHNLPFTLLADPEKEVVSKYGVYNEKKSMGRTYVGVNRVTYLIDENGRIAEVFPNVDVNTHSKDILSII